MIPKKLHELGQLYVACETYIECEGKILMHKRAETKKVFPGFWIGPGGMVDEGEDVLSAAMREIQEETSVKVKSEDVHLKVLSFHHHIDKGEVWVEYLFRATIPSFQEITNETVEGTSQWIPLQDLLVMDNVFPPAKHYFDHILNNKPGILYGSSEWKNSELYSIKSEVVGL